MTKEDIVGALESHFDDIQKEEFDRVHNKWIELIENKDEVFDMSLEFTAWMIEQDEKLSPVSAKVNRKGVVVEDYVEHLLNLGNCECKYHCDANKTVIKCDSCKSASMHNEPKDMDGHWNCGVCNCSHKFKSNARECCALITKTDKSANQKEDE